MNLFDSEDRFKTRAFVPHVLAAATVTFDRNVKYLLVHSHFLRVFKFVSYEIVWSQR